MPSSGTRWFVLASMLISPALLSGASVAAPVSGLEVGGFAPGETRSAHLVYGAASVLRGPDPVEIAAPVPPHLMAAEADFNRMNLWAEEYSWAASARNSILSRADAWPESHLDAYQLDQFELPPEGGQWIQYYVCPVHGYPLTMVDPTTHLCPMGETYTGWPYDQVVYTWRIDDAGKAAADLGLAYRLTGDSHYAEEAAEILLAFAETYLRWPIHDEHDVRLWDGARAHAQTLDEAVWLIPVAWAYDLIADSAALDDETRARIQRLLLRPAAQVLQHYKTKGNWQVWHNAGIAAVGYTLNDQELISLALDGRPGMNHLLQFGVNDDGLWWEGSWSYHFYALEPFVYFAEMARQNGLDMYADPKFAAMFTSPLDALLPDLSLPPFNDSRAENIASQAWAYEVAYSRLGDPRAAAVANMVTRGRWALLFGAETLPAESLPEQETILLEDSGYAVLRQPGEGSQSYVALDFGPHGAWHGHYDKLSFISYGAGARMALDPGTQSYAAPTHDTWDKKTVAHNTVVMDEGAQARNKGTLEWFHKLPHIAAVRAGAGDAYPGAEAYRTQVLTSEYLLDRFDIGAHVPTFHRFDWIYHNPGVVTTGLTLEPYSDFPDRAGYQHLTDTQATTSTGPWEAFFSADEGSLPGCRVWMDGSPGEETTVVTGLGLGPDLSVPVPFVMARRAGYRTIFATLFETVASDYRVQSFETREETTLEDGSKVLAVKVSGLTAELGDGKGGQPYEDRWALASIGTERQWTAWGLSGDGELALVRQGADGVRRMILAGGTLLLDADETLIRSIDRLDGIEVIFGGDGAVELSTESALTSEVFIHATDVASVVVNGQPTTWSEVGELIRISP